MNFRGSSEPTSEAQVVALEDEAVMDVVEELAVELDTFAFERERVLAKLDIRAAAHARRTARELRLVVARLPLAADAVAREDGLQQLGELLGRTHTLLEGDRFATPGRPAASDPPMPSSRDARSTPAPISDVHENSREAFELDYDHLPETLAGEADLTQLERDPDLPVILLGTIAPLHPNHRPTAPAMAAVSLDDELDDRAPTPRAMLPVFGGDDYGENDFDDETVAKKVAWQRSGNRLLGR